MGFFDSLHVPYQSDRIEVQTKRMDSTMGSFDPGDRLVPADQAPGWKNFVEDFLVAPASSPGTTRLLVVLTYNGVWVDHAFALPEHREEAARGLFHVWQNPRYATWGFGRWIERFADDSTLDAQSWREVDVLLLEWNGGLRFRLHQRSEDQPPATLSRLEVVNPLEQVIHAHRARRLNTRSHWPALDREVEAPETPELSEDHPENRRGWMDVPPPAASTVERWDQAVQALLTGDWTLVQRLAEQDRPAEPHARWQEALDTALLDLLPSATFGPLVQQLLAWGASPPATMNGMPLPQWAVVEQGLSIETLNALRAAQPTLAWWSVWLEGNHRGYERAWAQCPPGQGWPERDAAEWVAHHRKMPTALMASMRIPLWERWHQADGRLFNVQASDDPLMVRLNQQWPTDPEQLLWLIEHREAAGWKVKHVKDLRQTLEKLAQERSEFQPCWAAFERLWLHRAVPNPKRPRNNTADAPAVVKARPRSRL